jgi:hypothetical protein
MQGNPLWQQYTALAERYSDNIVFMKVGDFYEVMGDKANMVVNELGSNHHVTGRDVGLLERMPMFGVPAHNFDKVVAELVNKDLKIVVAEKEDIRLLTKSAQEQPPTIAPAPQVDLKIVADYMQKQYDTIQATDPNKEQGQAAFSMAVKRLEQANERIPNTHPQLKALLTHAAQSPDLSTLKERMDTLKTDFIQHYSTAVQNTVDMSGKAEQPAQSVNNAVSANTPPAATATKQNDPAPSAPAPTTKAPAHSENVAAIEARVNAGEAVNLSDLSDAMKKDKAAQSQAGQTQTGQSGKATGKTGQTANKTGQTRNYSKGKTAAKNEQPTIKDQLAANKKQLDEQKSAPTKTVTKNKNNGLGD